MRESQAIGICNPTNPVNPDECGLAGFTFFANPVLQLFGFEIVHSATGWSPTEMSDFLSCLHKKRRKMGAKLGLQMQHAVAIII